MNKDKYAVKLLQIVYSLLFVNQFQHLLMETPYDDIITTNHAPATRSHGMVTWARLVHHTYVSPQDIGTTDKLWIKH